MEFRDVLRVEREGEVVGVATDPVVAWWYSETMT